MLRFIVCTGLVMTANRTSFTALNCSSARVASRCWGSSHTLRSMLSTASELTLGKDITFNLRIELLASCLLWFVTTGWIETAATRIKAVLPGNRRD